MTAPGRTGLVGGTFDPFHLGHLAVAHAAQFALALDEVRIIPARVPPHRPVQPQTSAPHRFAMAALGVANERGLVVDDIELAANGPSFTASTLARFHERGYAAAELFFIIGADAFAEIAAWRDYPRVLDLAQFAVVSRPGRSVVTLRSALPALAARMRDVGEAGGRISVEDGQPSILLIDAETPNVSATRVRELAAARQPLNGLVPALVEDHIVRHRLYDTASSPAAGSFKAASPLHEQEPV
jgi:nicotinate-nucleotide adenylyltransferase